jgi:Tol biopolymer transport system component
MTQRMTAVAFALFACVFFSRPAGAQSFTLQQVLSAPFSSGLQAAPVGKRVLWIANQEGRRNIYIAEPGNSEFPLHYLIPNSADDGVDIGEVTWTPDGEKILYVRGGDLEFPERPSPNPDLLTQGVSQEIWLESVLGGDGRKLAEGRVPEVSPDGATVAYINGGQIWTLALRDPAARPVQLFHGRGTLGSLSWSPDGKFLAFTSRREDHGFIGVYSFVDQELRYLDPSTEIDEHPVWSPDSRHIAFARIPPDTSGVSFKPRREAQPWSIRVADVTTGSGHEGWHPHAGPGSVFHETETEQQLFWSANGRIIFPWEGSGWLHLYGVAASGRADAIDLTPGEFEVDHVAFSNDRKTLAYSSNQGDIDRRHIWEVPTNGGPPYALTHGDGLEVTPAFLADGTVVLLHADAHVPMRPAVVGKDGALQDLAPQLIPEDFPAAKLVTPQQVIFSAADGLQIHGQLFLPANAEEGKKHAAVVFFHGCSRRQMLLGWHYMDY